MTHFLRHWLTPHKSNNHRAKILHPDGLFFVAIILIAIHFFIAFALKSGPLARVLGYSSDITSDKVLSAVNAQRSQAGVKPLTNNQKLASAALSKANDMIAGQYWAHNTPSGKQPWEFIKQAGYRYEVAGENLARNFSGTDGMVNAWLASATHRANLLSGKYTETGIAVVNGKMDGVETTLVVQMFGSPSRPVLAQAEKPASTAEKTVIVPEEVETPEPETSIALAPPGPTAVLGEESPVIQPVFSPLDLYRWTSGILLSFLIAVLLHDSLANKKKKHAFFGKNLAHLILLISAFTTLALSQGGKLL
jgi:hypothetical protein